MPTEIRKPAILVVDDIPDQVATLHEVLEAAGFEVHGALTRESALQLINEVFIDLLLLDQRLGRTTGTRLLTEMRAAHPGLSGIIISASVDLPCALDAIRAGALDLLEKPAHEQQMVAAVARALENSSVVRNARYARWHAERTGGFPGIVGQSDTLKKAITEARHVAATPTSVLIQGESGTGKELLARAIHASSDRRNQPFVAVNAGALPPSLLESTLFGSKKGAFTDSHRDQVGLFEAAHGGTLFLDEIGDTTPDVQVRLLRVLQEKTVIRLGDVTPIAIDVRVLAATNRDLRVEVNQKRFRDDLYFRLAVVTITMPKLSERRSDIRLLANHFLEKRARELGKAVTGFAPGCVEKLEAYKWPGNVRELDNVIQRALILGDKSSITPNLLLLEGASTLETPGNGVMLDGTYEQAKESLRRVYFERLYYERAKGVKAKAAELADIDRSVLYDHLTKLGIS